MADELTNDNVKFIEVNEHRYQTGCHAVLLRRVLCSGGVAEEGRPARGARSIYSTRARKLSKWKRPTVSRRGTATHKFQFDFSYNQPSISPVFPVKVGFFFLFCGTPAPLADIDGNYLGITNRFLLVTGTEMCYLF